MKILANLPFPKEVTAAFPWGAIVNEIDPDDGTPVVRELYNDILVNCYKLLALAGIAPSDTEDSENTQYQLVEALQKLPNLLNDVEHVVSKSALVWSVNLPFSLLPNKYFFFARAAEAYISGPSYIIKGSEPEPGYNFTSPTGFKASDELLVILDQSGARAYSLSALSGSPDEVFIGLGIPVAYNNTQKLYYDQTGYLFTDVPSVDYLEGVLRVETGNGDLLVGEMLILQGYILCFCFVPSTAEYSFYHFDLTDLSTPAAVASPTIGSGDDYFPYIYTDGLRVYVTNLMNFEENDNRFTILEYDGPGASLSFVSALVLDGDFEKTSNAAIKSGMLYTFKNGVLARFDLTDGTRSALGTYPGLIGNLFNFRDAVYFCIGEVAKKWF